MRRTAGSDTSERLILFTLVDLLVQVIFFALFVTVLAQQKNEQLSLQLQQKLIPYEKVAEQELISFVDAVSTLVPLKDIDKSHTIGDNQKDVRDRLIALSTILDKVRDEHLATNEVIKDLSPKPVDSSALHKNLQHLESIYVSMTPTQRQSLLQAAKSITVPICFNGRLAFTVVEVQGGFIVSNPIPDIAVTFNQAVSGLSHSIGGSVVTESELDTFGGRFVSSFSECHIRVKESSQTNDLRQFKHLNEYFLLY